MKKHTLLFLSTMLIPTTFRCSYSDMLRDGAAELRKAPIMLKEISQQFRDELYPKLESQINKSTLGCFLKYFAI